MHKLRINPQALADLKSVKTYINEEIGNPGAARAVVSMLMTSIGSLKEKPLSGKRLSALIDIDSDYYYIISVSYLILYKADGETVSVYRVLNGRRDYAKVLFGMSREEEGE